VKTGCESVRSEGREKSTATLERKTKCHNRKSIIMTHVERQESPPCLWGRYSAPLLKKVTNFANNDYFSTGYQTLTKCTVTVISQLVAWS
jgi:hypothetical protein